MSVYLITWDLNKQKENYNQARQRLIDHLARYEHIKDPGLDSVWFLSSSSSAAALDADIRAHMDNNDRLIVTQLVKGQYQGWLSSNIWAWIDGRI
jgi:hypothetical protein